MRRPRSLRAQITLSVVLVTVLVVALSGLAIALRIDHQDRAQVDRQLRERAAKVQSDSGKTSDRGSLLAEDDKPGGARNDTNLLAGTDTVTRVLVGDTVVAQRGEGATLSEAVPAERGLSTVTIDGQDWRSLVEPTTVVADGRLQVLQSLAPVERRLQDNGRIIALIALAATLTTALVAWLVSGIVLRPLERLRHGVARIRLRDDAAARLPAIGGQQEIQELAATLNNTLERLQVSTQATRRFTADAGHELRTPLTGLGIDLETLRQNPELPAARRAEMLEAMTREHARMAALLSGLQQLARGDAEVLPERRAIDIADILSEAVRSARERHPGVMYRFREGPPALVDGWSDGIRRALDNLLDNAALHGKPDGAVDVALSTDGRTARAVVDDDGAGIAAEDRERLTRRFTRGAEPRNPGSGLGLALVDQQAKLHGGTFLLGDAPAGGLRATLTIPLRVGEPGKRADERDAVAPSPGMASAAHRTAHGR